MTEELELDLMIKFKVFNVAEYTTKYGDYYGLVFAGAEIATKELQESLMKLQKSTFNMIDEKNNRITELEKENAELKHTIAELRRDKDNLNTHTKAQEKLSEYRSNQLTKAKEVINDLVHLGEFNEHTDEEYFNYQVHEVLKNAEQFLKE